MTKLLLVGEIHGIRQNSEYLEDTVRAILKSSAVMLCLEIYSKWEVEFLQFLETGTNEKRFSTNIFSGYLNLHIITKLNSLIKYARSNNLNLTIKCIDENSDRDILANILKLYKFFNGTIVVSIGRYHIRDNSELIRGLKKNKINFKRIFLTPNGGKFYNTGTINEVSKLDNVDNFTRQKDEIINIGNAKPVNTN